MLQAYDSSKDSSAFRRTWSAYNHCRKLHVCHPPACSLTVYSSREISGVMAMASSMDSFREHANGAFENFETLQRRRKAAEAQAACRKRKRQFFGKELYNAIEAARQKEYRDGLKQNKPDAWEKVMQRDRARHSRRMEVKAAELLQARASRLQGSMQAKVNADFETQGYSVLKDLFTKAEIQSLAAVARDVSSQSFQDIFQQTNLNKKGEITYTGDGYRQQAEVEVAPDGNFFVAAAWILAMAMGVDYVPLEFLVLRSLRGCKQQPAHADYDRHQMQGWGDFPPVSCLIAVQPGTKWVSYDNSLRYYSMTDLRPLGIDGHEVALAPGDVVIWHGAHVHAGAAYPQQKENRRLFFKGISLASTAGTRGYTEDTVGTVRI